MRQKVKKLKINFFGYKNLKFPYNGLRLRQVKDYKYIFLKIYPFLRLSRGFYED